jgi:hypothetical protein
LQLLEYFHKVYPERIKYYSEIDSSGGEAANKAILKSKGDIIGLLGSDDSYTQGAIKNVVDLFSNDYFDDVYFLYGSCNYIKDGRIEKTVIAREPKKNELINGRFYVYGPSMFFRRELFDKIGYFSANEGYAPASDLDLLIRISKQYDMHYTTKVLSNWRIRSWLLSGKSWERTLKVLKSSYIITRDYGGKCTWSARAYFLSRLIEFFRPISQPVYNIFDRYVNRGNRIVVH